LLRLLMWHLLLRFGFLLLNVARVCGIRHHFEMRHGF
jgi:hypothetical protein